jgi:hypothetical protein
MFLQNTDKKSTDVAAHKSIIKILLLQLLLPLQNNKKLPVINMHILHRHAPVTCYFSLFLHVMN